LSRGEMGHTHKRRVFGIKCWWLGVNSIIIIYIIFYVSLGLLIILLRWLVRMDCI